MEVARRRGRRRKKLLDDLKDRRWYSHLKEEALDRSMWRHSFGGGFGPVVRQNTEWMRRQFLHKMWPNPVSLPFFIVSRISHSSLTLLFCNTSSFLTRAVKLIFSVLLQHQI